MLATLFLTLPLFTPPASWEAVETKKQSDYVVVSFTSKEGASFRPTMNLAKEEVEVSLKEYVKAVKTLSLKEPKTSWRDLGTIDMKAGQGRLAEITTKTAHGEMKTLQAFFIEDKTAYILTASSLKTEFPKLQEVLLKAFSSFSLEDTIFTALSNKVKETRAKEIFANLGQISSDSDESLLKQRQWETLRRDIALEFPEMGAYWQLLALKEGLRKINGS